MKFMCIKCKQKNKIKKATWGREQCMNSAAVGLDFDSIKGFRSNRRKLWCFSNSLSMSMTAHFILGRGAFASTLRYKQNNVTGFIKKKPYCCSNKGSISMLCLMLLQLTGYPSLLFRDWHLTYSCVASRPPTNWINLLLFRTGGRNGFTDKNLFRHAAHGDFVRNQKHEIGVIWNFQPSSAQNTCMQYVTQWVMTLQVCMIQTYTHTYIKEALALTLEPVPSLNSGNHNRSWLDLQLTVHTSSKPSMLSLPRKKKEKVEIELGGRVHSTSYSHWVIRVSKLS